MPRNVILFNLALLTIAASLVWAGRRQYLEMKAHESEVLRRGTVARTVAAPISTGRPAPITPAFYIDIAERNLFAKDRNSTVVIDPPPAKPEPPMPSLPKYFGQIGIPGQPIIFLSVNGDTQKRFHSGDQIGGYELVGFNLEIIILRWGDKRVERKLADLRADRIGR